MNTKKIVEDILEEYPKTRDSDFLLCMHVYVRLGFAHKGHKSIKIDLENFEDFPALETISRIRREIQNEEQRLKASPEVEDRRLKNKDRLTNYYSTKGRSASSFPNSWMS